MLGGNLCNVHHIDYMTVCQMDFYPTDLSTVIPPSVKQVICINLNAGLVFGKYVVNC